MFEQATDVFRHVARHHKDDLLETGSVDVARSVDNLSCAGVRFVSSSRLRRHLQRVRGLTCQQRAQVTQVVKDVLCEVLVLVGDECQPRLTSLRREIRTAFTSVA